MNNIFILTLFFLISCSPRVKDYQKENAFDKKVSFSELIEFNQVNIPIFTDDTSELQDSSNVSLNINALSYDIEVGDSGKQIIKLFNPNRRSTVNSLVLEENPVLGVSLSNNCSTSLKRRQSCYLIFNIDSGIYSEGTNISYSFSINGYIYFLNFNIIPSTKLTLEQEAEGLIELSPELSILDFGTLIENENESIVKTIQLRNKSRKKLPITIDTSQLNNYETTTTCLLELDRKQGCVIFIKLNSKDKSEGLLNEILTVNNSVYNLSAMIDILDSQELSEREELLAISSTVINPLNLLDLGTISENRIKADVIKIKNESRNDIALNITSNNLNEFSISSCPSLLKRYQSCYLNVLYDSTGAALGLKSENININGSLYTLKINVETNNVSSGNTFDSGVLFDNGVVFE